MDKVKRIGKGYMIGILLFAVLSLLGAVLLKLTPFPEAWGFFYLLLIMAIGCLFIGIYTAAYFKKAGLLCGLGFSAGFILLIIVLVSLCFSTLIGVSMFTPMYFIPLGIGGIGGIAGANM